VAGQHNFFAHVRYHICLFCTGTKKNTLQNFERQNLAPKNIQQSKISIPEILSAKFYGIAWDVGFLPEGNLTSHYFVDPRVGQLAK
jgi:hypothetical protein